MGAVSLGQTYLFPPLSSRGSLVVRPWLRFHIPLIEPDFPLSKADRPMYPSSSFRLPRIRWALQLFRLGVTGVGAGTVLRLTVVPPDIHRGQCSAPPVAL
jgi:hypothetical protein